MVKLSQAVGVAVRWWWAAGGIGWAQIALAEPSPSEPAPVEPTASAEQVDAVPAAPPAPAEPPPLDDEEDAVIVEVQRRVERPCRRLDRADLVMTPARTPDELLRRLPGVHVSQALGQGGAWRTAYRGGDGAFGQDIALSVEGVPINEPSHVGWPGYAELSFLPRGLIGSVELCSGATRAEVGAFGVSGSADVQLGLAREGVNLRLGGGTDGSGGVTVGWRPRRWGEHTFLVGEVEGGEGIGGSRGWRQLKLAGGIEGNAGGIHARAVLALQDGRFDVPGVIREEDLRDGDARFQGGYRTWAGDASNRRLLLAGRLVRPWSWGGVEVGAWFGARGWRMTENLSGFRVDPVNGDGVERRQGTFEVGLNGRVSRSFPWLGDETRLEAGADLRAHFLRPRVQAVDTGLNPVGELSRSRLEHTSLAAWARVRFAVQRRFVLEPGLRVEQIDLRVRDVARDPDPLRASAFVLAPKVRMLVAPVAGTQLHLAWGRGYRPPDAGEVVEAGPVGVTRRDTAEVGIDTVIAARVRLSAAGFYATSPSERIEDAFTRQSLGTGATRRVGGEGGIGVYVAPQVRLDLEGSGADARLVATGERLPYVPGWQVVAGLSAEDVSVGRQLHLSGGLRVWTVGRERLPGGFFTRPQVGADATARLTFRRWSFDAQIDNLVPLRRRDAEVVLPSRWTPDETAPDLPVRHLIAGEPFVISIGVSAWF